MQTKIIGDSTSQPPKISPVFWGSLLVLIPIMMCILIFPIESKESLNAIHSVIVKEFGWVYSLIVGVILGSILLIAFSSYGNIKLGPDHSMPSFSYVTWVAMLFSAGMGIGIMFYGVSEPVTHFVNAPAGSSETVDAAKQALNLTFFHWGLHAWGIYAVVGLILALFSFRYKLPLSLRSALYPLIGDRIYGPIGHMVDIFAILGTIFGLSTSLGLGVTQIASGLNTVFGMVNTPTVQLVLIVVLMFLAGASAVSGLTKGLKILSELNLYLALLLLFLITALGPTSLIFQAFLQNTGQYIASLVGTSFNLYAYEPQSASQAWLSSWTITYWGWWLSWSPFVGIFIARISRGRTIREFVMGVLIVPCALTFFWMTAFGNTAIEWIMHGGNAELLKIVQTDSTLALFEFLKGYPFTQVFHVFAILMIIIFFVTSADSGALVVDMLGGQRPTGAPPVLWQRIFWVVVITLIAIILMAFNGIDALQKVTLISSLPYACMLLLAIFGLFKALKRDLYKRHAQTFANMAPHQSPESWKNRISNMTHLPTKPMIEGFLEKTVIPAMQELIEEFKQNKMDAKWEQKGSSVRINVVLEDNERFMYHVRMTRYSAPSFKNAGDVAENEENGYYYRAEIFLNEGGQDYDIHGYTKEQVIADVLNQFEKHLHFLHMVENHAF